MEKLNIAEILKNCPKGTKLYSPLCGECEFDSIRGEYINTYKRNVDTYVTFNCFGQHYSYPNDSECLLFPSKENRDWSTFQRPFKDGDVLAYQYPDFTNPSIYIHSYYQGLNTAFYVALSGDGDFKVRDKHREALYGNDSSARFATEEEKQKLFDAIKANGYKWNAETKTLEKLIGPKFKVGDRIRHKTHIRQENAVTELKDTHYILDDELALPFTSQDDYELVPNKFGITTLNPCDKVLVRNNSLKKWRIHFFENYNKRYGAKYPFVCMFGCKYSQCIPYKGNEHLLNTANDCDDYYKTWE